MCSASAAKWVYSLITRISTNCVAKVNKLVTCMLKESQKMETSSFLANKMYFASMAKITLELFAPTCLALGSMSTTSASRTRI